MGRLNSEWIPNYLSCKICKSSFVASRRGRVNCPSCCSEIKNKERDRLSNLRHYANNKEKCRERSRVWRKGNKEKVADIQKRYSIRHARDKHLKTLFNTLDVTDEQKALAAFIKIGVRVCLGRIEKSTINERIYRVRQGDTYAAYE